MSPKWVANWWPLENWLTLYFWLNVPFPTHAAHTIIHQMFPVLSTEFFLLIWITALIYDITVGMSTAFIYMKALWYIYIYIFNTLLSLDSDWSIMRIYSLICPWTFVIISCPFNNMFIKLTFNEGGNLNLVIYTYFAVLTMLYCTISHNPKLFKFYLHRKSYQTLFIEGWRNSILL